MRCSLPNPNSPARYSQFWGIRSTLSDKRANLSCAQSQLGEAAGVVVDERKKGDRTVRKYASAHDLRRAFGRRWSTKIKPTQLEELMRHSSINTTLAYYVGEDAEATADALWAELGNNLGNLQQRPANDQQRQNENHTAKQG
jgi:integrase